MNLEKKRAPRFDSIGHANVLPMTNARKRSAWRSATAKPIGPPQSWTISEMSRRSSSSTSRSITSACSAGVYP